MAPSHVNQAYFSDAGRDIEVAARLCGWKLGHLCENRHTSLNLPSPSQVTSLGNSGQARIPYAKRDYADKWVHLTWSLKVTDASSPIKSEWTVWVNGVLTKLKEADTSTTIAPSGVVGDMPYPERTPEKDFFRLEFLGHNAFELDGDVDKYFRGEFPPLSSLNCSLSASSIFWRMHRHHLDTLLASLTVCSQQGLGNPAHMQRAITCCSCLTSCVAPS